MREAATEAKVDNSRAGYWQGPERWDVQSAMPVCIPAHHWKPLLQHALANNRDVRESHTYQTAWTYQSDYRDMYPHHKHRQGTAEGGFISKTTLVVSKFAYHRSETDTLKMMRSAKGHWPIPNQMIRSINAPKT